MRRIFIAIAGLAILITASYYGTAAWAQRRAERDVAAMVAAAHGAGGNLTHGPVRFDLIANRLTLADVVSNAADFVGPQLQVGRVVVEGMSRTADGRMAARRIEISDLAVTVKIPALPDQSMVYKAPRIEIVGYSGPATFPELPAGGTPADLIRSALTTFSATSITSLAVPEMSVSLAASGTASPQPGMPTLAYRWGGISLQDIGGGRVRSARIDRVAVTGDTGTPEVGKFEAQAANFALADFDVAPILAALDPASDGNSGGYRQVYGQFSAGPYSVSMAGAARMQIDALELDGLAIDPAKLSLPNVMRLVEAIPHPGASPAQTQQQLQRLFEGLATLYEGIRFGRSEERGIQFATPPNGQVKIATFRISAMERGRIGEIAVEGLDVVTQQPVKIGRFALQGIGVSGLIRAGLRLSTLGREPESADLLPLLHLLAGVEIRDLTAPDQSSGKLIHVDTLQIGWGNFIGVLPSRARTTLQMSAPVPANEEPFNWLADAGFSNIALAFDLGVAWNEPSSSLVLSPATLTLTNLVGTEVKASLRNITRGMFSTDPTAVLLAGVMAEVGPVEIAMHDLGGIELAVAQRARQQQVTPEEARRGLIADATKPLAALAASNPDLAALADAIGTYIKTPSSTLSVTITPKTPARLMTLAAELEQNPEGVLADFHIEAVVNSDSNGTSKQRNP